MSDRLSKFEAKFKKPQEQPIIQKPKSRQIKVPFAVQVAWEDLSPSIASVFNENKWKSKYASYLILKQWMEKVIRTSGG